MEVSPSGFYEWWDRPQSAATARREFLSLLIKKAFADSDETYGYRRVHAQLARWGEQCTPELVRGLMRELGLVACQPRPWRHSLTQGGGAGPIADLVGRDFTADAPGQKMVGDITYIPTWEGWLFHARRDVAQYIELRYNSQRLHSGLGYKTPREVHDEYQESQEAA